VITATTDEELAYKIRDKFDPSGKEIKVTEYDDAETYLKPCFSIVFDDKGSLVEVIERNEPIAYKNDDCYYIMGKHIVDVVAEDKETAIRIATEKCAKYINKI
jgi:hypothetical protein